jgi:pilus assembly protein CpaE
VFEYGFVEIDPFVDFQRVCRIRIIRLNLAFHYWAVEAMTEIRIMIVDDNPQFADSIKRILGFETDFKVAGTASSGKQALEMLVHSPMDIALVDNNLPDMNGFQLTETIAERFPEVQVIILSVDYEKQMIVNAMRSGAKDYIQKPPTSEILVKSIRSAFKKKSRSTAPLPPLPEPKAMGKIIAVYSGKGGVGCTLIATNLAVHLNSREVPCVLVDADMQFGDASLFLNLNTTYSIFDLINVAGELDQNVVDDVLLMHPDGLEVLAAPPQPEMADSITVDVMHKVLAYLRSAFAYVY